MRLSSAELSYVRCGLRMLECYLNALPPEEHPDGEGLVGADLVDALNDTYLYAVREPGHPAPRLDQLIDLDDRLEGERG